MTSSIYFCHGLPGSPLDTSLMTAKAIAPDLLAASDPLSQFDEMTAHLSGQVHIAGFSIGARIACLIAANRPDRIAKLTLISPGAPLQTGDYLSQMAGRPVFLAAQKSEAAMARFALIQSLAIRAAPGLLLSALFAKSGPDERAFARNQKPALQHGLRQSLLTYRAAYIAHLRDYVADWSDLLPQISCPTDIYHGTQDKWAPVTMAHALNDAIERATLHLTPTEHYTTLAQVRL
ncbi:alpha/beta fold hydrolase [Litoreibacter janthinus]|nr:alpha/beta fold hydrolase [Litoreibacter janthinus]